MSGAVHIRREGRQQRTCKSSKAQSAREKKSLVKVRLTSSGHAVPSSSVAVKHLHPPCKQWPALNQHQRSLSRKKTAQQRFHKGITAAVSDLNFLTNKLSPGFNVRSTVNAKCDTKGYFLSLFHVTSALYQLKQTEKDSNLKLKTTIYVIPHFFHY